MQCPVCARTTDKVSDRCIAIGKYFGYPKECIEELFKQQSSIMIPYHELKRIVYFMDFFSKGDEREFLLEAAYDDVEPLEKKMHTHQIIIKPSNVKELSCSKVFIKEDATKSMVLYHSEGGMAYFGSEERDVLFSWLADEVFDLGKFVLPAAIGVSGEGKKFCVTPFLETDEWHSMASGDIQDLKNLYHYGILMRLVTMDYLIGQNDRNIENIFIKNRTPDNQELVVKLIDNDFCFSKTTELYTAFAYLQILGENIDFSKEGFGTISEWLQSFSLSDVLMPLFQFSLPAFIIEGVISRYITLMDMIKKSKTLEYFIDNCFLGEKSNFDDDQLEPSLIPNTSKKYIFRTLIRENEQEYQYIHMLWYAHENSSKFQLFKGGLFSKEPIDRRDIKVKNRRDAERHIQRICRQYTEQGYQELLLRRFLVQLDKKDKTRSKGKIVLIEMKLDDQIYAVAEKVGDLGIYEEKKRIKNYTTTNYPEAEKIFKKLEKKYQARGFKSIQTILSSFRQQEVTFFGEG